MNSVEYYETMGCTRINGFLDETTISIVSLYMENRIRRGEWVASASSDGVTKYCYYADPLMEVLLLKCKDAVEQATGKELLPTYSYSRIYQPGEQLEKHVDRESCEISVTVNVASKNKISNVYTKYKENYAECHTLMPGDALVYKGCEAVHWREVLGPDELNVQFMLHYVDKNGPHKAFEKDRRTVIGSCCNITKKQED